MLEKLQAPELDVLYRTANAFRADQRADKLDLGVGVYRDESGKSPVMACVREAEERLAKTNDSKAYLPLAGEPGFLAGMSKLLFQEVLPSDIAQVQSVGGTGGVRLALELAQAANPSLTVHLGVPSWPNHQGICNRLGIPVRTYDYLENGAASAANTLAAIDAAQPGDVLILHGPCHNPTGLDLSDNALDEIIQTASRKGVIPLIDAAYYGLGNELDADLARLRGLLVDTPECFLTMSGSKAFGLYRDRIGVLFAKCPSADIAAGVQANAESLARVNYSAPAAHGAQVIGTILADSALAQAWRDELGEMRARMTQLRAQIRELSGSNPALATIWQTKGIFSLLPIDAAVTDRLAEDHAIYMPPTGRINLAGLSSVTAPRFVSALEGLI